MSSETPKPPQAPTYTPINIPNVAEMAYNYDTQGYDLSDIDFAARFPGLVATRNAELDDAYAQLTGELSPDIQNRFMTTGLQGGLGISGGDPLGGLGFTAGSAGYNAAAASVANQALQKQDMDRSYFSQLLGENPQRAFGVSGSDVANFAMANSGNLNASNQQQYQSQLAGIYAQGQQGAATGQQIAAIGSLIAALGRR